MRRFSGVREAVRPVQEFSVAVTVARRVVNAKEFARMRSFIVKQASAHHQMKRRRTSMRPVLRAGRVRILPLLLAVMLVTPVVTIARQESLQAAPLCLEGSGTSRDPFLVKNAADLAKVGSGSNGCDTDKDYLQTADITLDAPPQGSSNHTPITNFSGTYDGGGFSISGVEIVSSAAMQGFFGVTQTAIIRRIHLTEAKITATSMFFHGGLIGYALDTVVTDASFAGTVTSPGDNVGGLIGGAAGSAVRRSFSSGTVLGADNVGGLIGFASNTGIDASFSTADVTATGGYVGGLVGYFSGGAQRLLYVVGSSTATSSLGASVVSGDRYDFGFILNTDSLSTSAAGSPLFSNVFNGAVKHFWLDAAADNAGTWDPGEITWAINPVQNLVGNTNGNNITLQVRASSSAPQLDGSPFLDFNIGLQWDPSDLNMTAGDPISLGDFLGTRTPPLDKASLFVELRNDRFDTATFASTLDAGFPQDGVITDSYTRGDVNLSGDNGWAGGLIGLASNTRANRVYSTGPVTNFGNGIHEGGLIGLGSTAVFANAFWDTDTSLQSTSDGGTGKPSSALKTRTTFTDTATAGLTTAWPLVNGQAPYVAGTSVWGICPAVNAGYPFLLWQSEASNCTASSSPTTQGPTPVTDAATGKPPVLPPGQVEAFIAGASVPVKVGELADGNLTVTGDDFFLALSQDTADDSPNRRDMPPMLPPRAPWELESRGFQPDTPVFVWLFSTPHLLGAFDVDATGTFAATIHDLPHNVSTCPHTLQIAGRLANGSFIAINLGVWVAPDGSSFTDVSSTQTHGPAVGCLESLGIVDGFDGTSFRQTQALRRGQAATMLTRLLDLAGATATFNDVADTTHATAIGAIEAAGLMQGFADGTFKADATMTRGQFATVLASAYRLEPKNVPFADAETTHSGALGALHDRGVITGFTDGTLQPDLPITRGQAASMLVRARQLLG